MKGSLLIIVAVTALAVAVIVLLSPRQPPFVGTWGTDVGRDYTFRANGTAVEYMTGLEYRWHNMGDTLLMSCQGQDSEVHWRVSDDGQLLTLDGRGFPGRPLKRLR